MAASLTFMFTNFRVVADKPDGSFSRPCMQMDLDPHFLSHENLEEKASFLRDPVIYRRFIIPKELVGSDSQSLLRHTRLQTVLGHVFPEASMAPLSLRETHVEVLREVDDSLMKVITLYFRCFAAPEMDSSPERVRFREEFVSREGIGSQIGEYLSQKNLLLPFRENPPLVQEVLEGYRNSIQEAFRAAYVAPSLPHDWALKEDWFTKWFEEHEKKMGWLPLFQAFKAFLEYERLGRRSYEGVRGTFYRLYNCLIENSNFLLELRTRGSPLAQEIYPFVMQDLVAALLLYAVEYVNYCENREDPVEKRKVHHIVGYLEGEKRVWESFGLPLMKDFFVGLYFPILISSAQRSPQFVLKQVEDIGAVMLSVLQAEEKKVSEEGHRRIFSLQKRLLGFASAQSSLFVLGGIAAHEELKRREGDKWFSFTKSYKEWLAAAYKFFKSFNTLVGDGFIHPQVIVVIKSLESSMRRVEKNDQYWDTAHASFSAFVRFFNEIVDILVKGADIYAKLHGISLGSQQPEKSGDVAARITQLEDELARLQKSVARADRTQEQNKG